MLKTITDPAKRCVIEKLLLDELAELKKKEQCNPPANVSLCPSTASIIQFSWR